MSVTNLHKEYDKHKWQWKRCRDVIAGKDAMLQNGLSRERFVGSLYNPNFNVDTYLPRLVNQTDLEYMTYADRAAFFNATGRTLDALTGLIFAKSPQWTLPAAIDRYADDISLTDTNLREFAEQVVEQQLAVGRVGLMVDYPADAPTNISVAAAEALNLRPFLRWYAAENITNWRTTYIRGIEVLTMVVLKELREIREDEFTSSEVDQYRVLDLTPEGYRVRVMTEDGALLSEIYPLQRGQRMNYIPFIILGCNSATTEVQKPPLLDMVETNIAHYRNSADYEHGLHFTGLPTPYVAGVQLDEGNTLSVGSMTAWVFPDPSAKAEYLEFKGDGLETLRNAMKDKEQRMAVLGARMLMSDTRGSEAVGTMELRTAAERSFLASIARAASDSISKALNIMAEWVGAPEECRFDLNTDYGASRMQPQMLQQMISAYQTDAIPLSVLFENLQRGEIISQAMTFEEYEAQLDDAGPSFDGSDDLDLDNDAENAAEQGLMQALRARLGV
jgi:hypothetical protein